MHIGIVCRFCARRVFSSRHPSRLGILPPGMCVLHPLLKGLIIDLLFGCHGSWLPPVPSNRPETSEKNDK